LVAAEVPEQQVVRTAAAAEAVPLIAWPGEATPPGTAVLADLVEGLNDERVLREALLDRRQLAGFDQFGQRWRRFEALRELSRVGDDGRAFELADQVESGLGGIRLGSRRSGGGSGSGGSGPGRGG